jgi:hypothetical protein
MFNYFDVNAFCYMVTTIESFAGYITWLNKNIYI